MGWGKAVIAWCDSPEAALAALLDLNHRFALDGHAPPSYGGVLGCFGLFEGAKAEQPVYGKVSSKALKGKYSQLQPALLEKVGPAASRSSSGCGGMQSMRPFLVKT